MTNSRHRACLAPVVILCLAAAFDVYAAPVEPIPIARRARRRRRCSDTLKDLVSIESGSGDREGLDRIAALIAERLQGAGRPGRIDRARRRHLPDGRHAKRDRQDGAGALHRHAAPRRSCSSRTWTPSICAACWRKQPFRIDGDRAYGLGIADDKQGIAVILHTLSVLKAMNSASTARSPC